MKELIYKFDMISPGYELKSKGQSGYRNPFGLVSTIGIFVLTLFSIQSVLINFIYKINPSVVIENFTVDMNNLSVDSSGVKFSFSFEQAGGARSILNTSLIVPPNITYKIDSTYSNTTTATITTNDTTVQDLGDNNEAMTQCLDESTLEADDKRYCVPSNKTVYFDESILTFIPAESVRFKTPVFVINVEFQEQLFNVSNFDSPIFFGSNKHSIFAESDVMSLRELVFMKKIIDISDPGFIFYPQRATQTVYELVSIDMIYSQKVTGGGKARLLQIPTQQISNTSISNSTDGLKSLTINSTVANSTTESSSLNMNSNSSASNTTNQTSSNIVNSSNTSANLTSNSTQIANTNSTSNTSANSTSSSNTTPTTSLNETSSNLTQANNTNSSSASSNSTIQQAISNSTQISNSTNSTNQNNNSTTGQTGPDKVSKDHPQIDDTPLQNSPKFQHQFSLQLKNNGMHITIKYTSFDDILTAFGGTFSTIFFLFQTVFGIACDLFMSTDLLNAIFHFHRGEYDREVKPTQIFNNYGDLQLQENAITIEIQDSNSKDGNCDKPKPLKILASSDNLTKISDNFYLQRKLFEKKFYEYHQNKRKSFSNDSKKDSNEVHHDHSSDQNDDLNKEGLPLSRRDQKEFTSLAKILDEKIEKRQAVTIGYLDFFITIIKTTFHCCCRLTVKDRMILTSQMIVDTHLSFENITRGLIDLQGLKNITIDKEFHHMIAIPSLNLDSENSISYLNQILVDNFNQFKDEEASPAKILKKIDEKNLASKEKYQKLLKNYIKSIF